MLYNQRMARNAHLSRVFTGGMGIGAGGVSSLLQNLIAYYTFESITADSTANGNTLTNHGATPVAGIIGEAAYFDKPTFNAWMTIAALSAAPSVTSCTLAFWWKASGAQGTFSRILDLGVGGSQLSVVANDGSGLGVVQTNNTNDTSGSFTPLADTWYFGVVTLSPTAVSFYVNNSLVGTTNVGPTGPLSLLTLGNYAANALSLNYNGALDELGIWSAVLTANQQTSLWNGGLGATYPFAGLP